MKRLRISLPLKKWVICGCKTLFGLVSLTDCCKVLSVCPFSSHITEKRYFSHSRSYHVGMILLLRLDINRSNNLFKFNDSDLVQIISPQSDGLSNDFLIKNWKLFINPKMPNSYFKFYSISEILQQSRCR